jgi:SAM-dependent methyltransferase
MKMSVDYSQVTETAGDDISKEQLLRLQTRYYFASQYCKGKDVLEVSCGTGAGLGILQKVSKKIVAGDYCSSLILTAFSHYGHRVPFLRFDAHFLPFKNNSFDVIICYEAMYYFKNPDIFVQECNRLLRQKGKLILCTANKDLPDFNPSPHSYFYFSPIEFKELLESQKFQIQCFGDCPVDYASIKQKLIEVDGWLRNRLRYCIWTDWKKPERKRKNLIRLGIPQGQAYAWSRTRMGGWAVALRRSLHECLKNIIFMSKVRYLALPSHWNVSKGGDMFHYTTFINYCLTLITNTPYFL